MNPAGLCSPLCSPGTVNAISAPSPLVNAVVPAGLTPCAAGKDVLMVLTPNPGSRLWLCSKTSWSYWEIMPLNWMGLTQVFTQCQGEKCQAQSCIGFNSGGPLGDGHSLGLLGWVCLAVSSLWSWSQGTGRLSGDKQQTSLMWFYREFCTAGWRGDGD